MPIEIRVVQGYQEYMACEEIQRQVWGPVNFAFVPHHMLLTVQRNGGCVLGAFDRDAPGHPMVGFTFGFLGRSEAGQLKHASHMAAVLPGYRDARIGERLKWAQREEMLKQGITLITWTFDPLISRNARLNISKLGAISRAYIRNIYGPEPEDPQGVLPSDRFQVEWWLNDEAVMARSQGLYRSPAAEALRTRAHLANPNPLEPSEEPIGDAFLMQIPLDVNSLLVNDLQRARAWRYQIRALAEAAFAQGFVVTAYAPDKDVGYYLLERREG
ncbi:hypothetical protein EYB53_021945 [Candidatus Chloroploca sp. M-50]|uniref:N-acetyltransferase domain-containing protein n=1 Tax=Candidatus Chloroploca mongolica TaxID=2528176 RepID=A0ABS4DG44_9CHLR|nr:hypothetical protein [Candidatus Chloroploca mongolica]MBP1468390.1 hypothetical protein [Candidatus Chloroploca mongolica]